MSTALRCCSFCGHPSHTVDACNDDSLFTNGENIYLFYQELLRTNLSITDIELTFFTHMRHNSFTMLRAICIRFLNGRSGWTKSAYINHIINNIEDLQIFEIIPSQQEPTMENFIRQYLSNNPYQVQDVTVVSSTTSVYHYTIKPRIHNNFKIEIDVTTNTNDCCNKKNNCPIKEITCPVCLEDNISSNNIVTLNCSHEYCVACISKIITNKPNCSLCRKNITRISIEDGNQELIHNLNKLITN